MDVFVEFIKNKCSQKANYLKLVEINKQKEFIELKISCIGALLRHRV